ncbi:MAG TPA: hypothetical protein VHN99_06630, partial [Deinococcales bacterium]|nr:hypothetical protein [Deinococcales bacterium]
AQPEATEDAPLDPAPLRQAAAGARARAEDLLAALDGRPGALLRVAGWLDAKVPAGPWMGDAREGLLALAEAGEAMADVLDALPGEPTLAEEGARHLAEAQARVRCAGEIANAGWLEPNAALAHRWLKDFTKRRLVFIERGMRRGEWFEPADAPLFRERLAEWARAWREPLARRKEREAWNRKFAYHAGRLGKASDATRAGEAAAVVKAVTGLVLAGAPLTDRALQARLAPLWDRLAGEGTPEFERVRAARPVERAEEPQGPDDGSGDAADPDCARVNALLRGTRLVLVGAVARAEAFERLRRAWPDVDVEWKSTRVHESFRNFEPAVVRPEVRAVVMLVRWSSHGFGDLARTCQENGKLFVRAEAGYHPRQLSRAILEQAGRRLAALEPAAPA